jgi:hypothetical protein
MWSRGFVTFGANHFLVFRRHTNLEYSRDNALSNASNKFETPGLNVTFA